MGLLASYIKIEMPIIVNKTFTYLANTATSLALISIGASFDKGEAIKRLKPAIAATFVKLIALPLIVLLAAYHIGFTSSEMVAILVMVASPTTVSCYVMSKNMKNDYVLTSNIIVLTTLLSSITLTFWIFILRALGSI